VLYVTERAVFRRAADGVELVEVAPGIDVERDILAHMAFRPRIAADCRGMDARLFKPEPMGLDRDIAARPRRYRSARVAEYLASQSIAKAAE
jgi:propionate CoA-transferase